jgi:hypothetical protein
MRLPQGNRSVEGLVEAWKPLVEQFRNLSIKFNRSFLLTEIGYCSGRNCDPNVHDSPRGHKDQAMHYEALLHVVEENNRF